MRRRSPPNFPEKIGLGSMLPRSQNGFDRPRGKTQFAVFVQLFAAKKLAIGSYRWEHLLAAARAALGQLDFSGDQVFFELAGAG